MGDIVWAIDPRQGTPTQLSQRMRLPASDLLPPRGIELQFTSTDEGHARLGMETRREVFLIAIHLGNSANTIAFHMRSIYARLQVHSKSEAVAKALRTRIVR